MNEELKEVAEQEEKMEEKAELTPAPVSKTEEPKKSFMEKHPVAVQRAKTVGKIVGGAALAVGAFCLGVKKGNGKKTGEGEVVIDADTLSDGTTSYDVADDI